MLMQLFDAFFAILVGIGVCMLYYVGTNYLLNLIFSEKNKLLTGKYGWYNAIQPWIFLAPALSFLGVYLVYPVYETFKLSFFTGILISFFYLFLFKDIINLLTNQDLLDTLKMIKSHMHSHTVFVIDIFVPDVSFLYRENQDKLNIMDFMNSDTNQKMDILESIDYNPLTEINRINWDFIDKNNISRFNYSFDMRMWFPDTLNRILTDCNFYIQNF